MTQDARKQDDCFRTELRSLAVSPHAVLSQDGIKTSLSNINNGMHLPNKMHAPTRRIRTRVRALRAKALGEPTRSHPGLEAESRP